MRERATGWTGGRWRGVVAAIAAAMLLASVTAQAQRKTTGEEVDLELVLAVDVSYSMDLDELELQRQGYVEAFRSKDVVQAIGKGLIGKIAVSFFDWAGYGDQRLVAGWTIIDGPESANAFADKIAAAPIRRAQRTSISGAIDYGTNLFDISQARGLRRVIDVSGDGPNNMGPVVTRSRDAAIAKGITINGLPLTLKPPSQIDIDKLDLYYADCVIGGPGSFMIPVKSRAEFLKAVQTKLILEISALQPPQPPLIQLAQAPATPRVPCAVGERQWQERWGDR